MTEQATEETAETEEAPSGTVSGPSTGEGTETTVTGTTDTDQTTEEEPETFPREYVVRLRDESAKYRQRAGKADELAQRLHTALVAATGRLADPTDLPFDEAHLDGEDAISTALDELLTRKPHLASRRPTGDVGQGATGSGDSVDLAGILRARA